MIDPFMSSSGCRRILASGADLLFWPRLDCGHGAELLEALIEHTPWRTESIVLWGKTYPQPRLTAWYGDLDARYVYSGLTLDPLPWTARLLTMKDGIERATGHRFNSVLLNYYRTERDSMGMHSDDEPELGDEPAIASFSVGHARTVVFKHKFDRDRKPVRIELGDGSLLLMRGPTQRNWKHGIAKGRRPLGPRVNLTFRHIVQRHG